MGKDASTFGGRALDRYVFDFETTPDASDVGAGAADFAPPDDAAPPAEAEPAWSGPSQEEWQQTVSTLEQLAQLAQPQQPFQQPQEQVQEVPRPDPFADDFYEQLDRYIDYKTQPIHEYVTYEQRQEGEQRGKDVLADLSSRDGEFNVDRAYEIGLARFRDATMTQQPSWELFEQTLGQAAKDVRAYEQQVAQAAIERFKNEMAGLGNAPRELSATGGTNGQQFTIPQGGGLMDVVRRHTGG